MTSIVEVRGLTKTYEGGFTALKNVSLDIRQGEILALLGPNGAGKTTLISTICGLSRATAGTVTVGGFDVVRDYRQARNLIGLVPQEITIEPFEYALNTMRFSRGIFGRPRDDAHIERLLRELSLWDKRMARSIELSGGMRRRLLIGKALAHEPRVLFLDEPTAGVDVELRKDMWAMVERLRKEGMTIILTTHYIEEAEAIADRIAVINKGEILLVEDKAALMERMGRKELMVELQEAVKAVPKSLEGFGLELENGGRTLVYCYDTTAERTGITALLKALQSAGLMLKDIQTKQSSLEEIFVGLVREDA